MKISEIIPFTECQLMFSLRTFARSSLKIQVYFCCDKALSSEMLCVLILIKSWTAALTFLLSMRRIWKPGQAKKGAATDAGIFSTLQLMNFQHFLANAFESHGTVE